MDKKGGILGCRERYPIDDPSPPNVFWTIQILQRESDQVRRERVEKFGPSKTRLDAWLGCMLGTTTWYPPGAQKYLPKRIESKHNNASNVAQAGQTKGRLKSGGWMSHGMHMQYRNNHVNYRWVGTDIIAVHLTYQKSEAREIWLGGLQARVPIMHTVNDVWSI